MNKRRISGIDNFIIGLDNALRTTFSTPVARRPYPANQAGGDGAQALSDSESRLSGELMRVNHAGEVCAQALYHGQGLTARNRRVREAMQQASDEENDHLSWCQSRLDELGEHRSRLTPMWYLGSFVIGSLAGMFGDRWSLGFLAETEEQVVRHLDSHLDRLPANDKCSRRIIEQMKIDEGRHANRAISAGAHELPACIKKVMHRVSRVMTFTAARI